MNNSMTTPFYGMIEEVRVMLVDNDTKFITQMFDLLTSYDYTGDISKNKNRTCNFWCFDISRFCVIFFI